MALERTLLKYRSNGKLLLSSEYLVLDGAEALAFPTKLGQTLTVENISASSLSWKSYTSEGEIWFEGEFDSNFDIISSNDKEVADNLSFFLKVAAMLNPDFVEKANGVSVETHLEFHRSWGLGSSSTLIANIAQWADVDPFVLQQESFPGSGYDIACAFSRKPIVYQLVDKEASYLSLDFSPSFKNDIYFVHLNKKQNSREGIKKYQKNRGDVSHNVAKANDFTRKFVACSSIEEFRKLIAQHELFISEIIGEIPVKQCLFPDFRGSIKSLGAWGGDFVMVVGRDVEKYFRRKGYETIISFNNMVLK
ncbi:MAG: GHMP kinase [Flavobacteriales bacterium]|nr:GHMP kinase [Flavobacteriales bacterium]